MEHGIFALRMREAHSVVGETGGMGHGTLGSLREWNMVTVYMAGVLHQKERKKIYASLNNPI